MLGIKFPVRVGAYGGAETIEGYSVVDQNILLAIKPAGSLHPWNQRLTPDEDLIFDIRDNRSGGLYSMHVRQFFSEMERAGYAKLLPGTRGLRIEDSGNDGEMVVVISYINLERNKEMTFKVPLSGGK